MGSRLVGCIVMVVYTIDKYIKRLLLSMLLHIVASYIGYIVMTVYTIDLSHF